MGSFLEEDFQNPPPALRKSPYGRISNGYEASLEETDDEYPCEDMMSKQIKEEGGLNSSNNTIPSGFFDPSSSTLYSDDTPTIICLNIPEGKYDYLLLTLDNGSGINLVKLESLRDDLCIDAPSIVRTLGSVVLTLQGRPYRFHVVDDGSLGEADCVIGRGFLKSEMATVDYCTGVVTLRGDNMNPIPLLTTEEIDACLANRTGSTNTPRAFKVTDTHDPENSIPPGYYRALDCDGEYHLYPAPSEEEGALDWPGVRVGAALGSACLHYAYVLSALAMVGESSSLADSALIGARENFCDAQTYNTIEDLKEFRKIKPLANTAQSLIEPNLVALIFTTMLKTIIRFGKN